MEKLILRDNDAFLIHYGQEGMHWYDRRYQNYDGSLTDEGRKHYGVGPPRKSKDEIKAEKKEVKRQAKIKAKRVANLKKAQKAKKKEAKLEAEKQRQEMEMAKKKQQLYIDGDLKELYKNRKLFTTEEYQKAVQRAELFSRTKPNEPVQAKDTTNKMQTGKLYVPEKTESKNHGGLTEKRKNTIINSGDPKLIKANMKYLSDSELNQAMNRLKIDGELKNKTKDTKDLEKAQKDRNTAKNGKSVTNTLTEGINNVDKFGKAAISAYNTYSQFATAVNIASGKETLPVFKNVENQNQTLFNKFLQNVQKELKPTNSEPVTFDLSSTTISEFGPGVYTVTPTVNNVSDELEDILIND